MRKSVLLSGVGEWGIFYIRDTFIFW